MQSSQPGDWSWPLWLPVPLYPYGQRCTLRREIVKDTVWTFEQIQGILYVVVPIRMTVVKLEAGGLLVYAPVAPTPECLRLLQELVTEHGDVKYIILPTISGIEHKVFVGPFARRFSQAQVFVAPGQWSFPLNLPLSWLGLPANRTQVLPHDPSEAPFASEFDYAVLGPIALGPGPFAEVALFHRRSRTLLVTDTIVSVPESPPAIVRLDPYPLLFHARDTVSDPIQDSETNRRKGWQRISLFAFYFRPSVLEVVPWGQAFRNAFKSVDRSRKAYFGLFPFQWSADWQRSFEALRGGGRPFVAPILQTLILNRAPQETLAWVEAIVRWDFQQIIPCHFDAPINAGSNQFRQAFSFFQTLFPGRGIVGHDPSPLPEKDFQLLRQLDTSLSKWGIVPPAKK